ncbi:nitrogen-specific signal transduction histidine kinase [Desulfomicrobium macestii]|uniref:Nitrogen-specific signal transduction histidine kinase n=1 Tax=Desulfomicrobium macestii TaxID=90731 RepID=A0ABR9H513_9BACT|nr:hypothetical protein [Desulfomicrobium macestii]MBE1425784.1 nitrogen-specific signal transduction histidine kinase [Desulfomicrobium macestii]
MSSICAGCPRPRAPWPNLNTKPPGVVMGLGFTVSYFIVTRSHKGRMRVESAPGEDTRFIVELPLTGGVRGSGSEECLDG